MTHPTAWQTVGPYYGIGIDWPDGGRMANDETLGERITIRGRVIDASGAAIPDAVVEFWQANAEGRYEHPEDRQNKPLDPNFKGFGRCGTKETGEFVFETIRPGPVPAPDGGLQAPHIAVGIVARGLLKRLVTRLYFSEDAGAHAEDPVLKLVPADRRSTLIAEPEGSGPPPVYRWDIVLQGDGETVFFSV